MPGAYRSFRLLIGLSLSDHCTSDCVPEHIAHVQQRRVRDVGVAGVFFSGMVARAFRDFATLAGEQSYGFPRLSREETDGKMENAAFRAVRRISMLLIPGCLVRL
jgi:hypothetical protein